MTLTCCCQFQVIPSLLCQRTDSTGKLPVPDRYAYISTEDMKQEGKPSSFAIQKCNLTKSRLVCGVTLAEVLLSWFAFGLISSTIVMIIRNNNLHIIWC